MTEPGLKTIKIVVFLCCAIFSFHAFASSIEGIQIYQKNLHQSEEHKQRLANDIDRYHNADNMWDKIRAEFALPHYEDNELVQAQIQWFLNNPDYLMRTAERAAPYLYFISQQVRKRHLPAELILLPIIESAYNPFNDSSRGAAGIWQLMPETASGYGIKQNSWYDGRRDVVASTKAALDYLAYLGSFFDGNWLLAIAAYDTGEGNVLSAIRKNNRLGESTDFWSLPVAAETRAYVPRLLALASIIAHYPEYNLELPTVSNAPYLAQVDIGGQIDLQHAATLAGLTLKEFKKLNPGYNRTTTDPNGPYKIILPIENVAQFTKNLTTSPGKAFESQHLYAKNNMKKEIQSALQTMQRKYILQPGDTLYMVRKEDTLIKIAKRFHVTIQTLLNSNQLKNPFAINYGQQLTIPTHLNKMKQQKYQLDPGDTVYMVREGDTLDKIAAQFHTSSPSIRVANLMSNSQIRAGDRLVIPTG